MKKYLLTFEFRYESVPVHEDAGGHKTKTVTVGIYDNIEDAVVHGNNALQSVSPLFDIRDKFKVKGLWGLPDKLVTNTFTKDRVHFFAKITVLDFSNLQAIATTAIKERKDFDMSDR